MRNPRVKTVKTSPKTRVQRLIERYESNQQFIQKVVSLTDQQYANEVFETGIMFLEQMYPPNDKRFAEHYQKHAYSAAFWKWWRIEWKKWENDLVNFLTMSTVKLSQNVWLQEMQQMAHDNRTEISFTESYLKKIQYVL